jgi:hypothetical protein
MEELSLTFSLKEQLHKEVALDGAILARHASAALKKSFPEVDWDGSRALAGETEVDLTAGRKRALLIVSLLFLVAASVTIYLYPDSVYVFVAGAIAILYAWIRVRSMGLR